MHQVQVKDIHEFESKLLEEARDTKKNVHICKHKHTHTLTYKLNLHSRCIFYMRADISIDKAG